MKKPHINSGGVKKSQKEAAILKITRGGKTYAIPKKIAEKYIVKNPSKNSVSDESIFSDLIDHFTEAGSVLKGVRTRENLSQIEFAERIAVTQANLSNMENGKRPIGKIIAKRIEKEFGVDYRYFLE